MKQEVWKFPLSAEDAQIVEMPAGSKILTVQAQNERAFLWALVNVETEAKNERRSIEMYGTGHPIQELPDQSVGVKGGRLVFAKRNYIGTFQVRNLVFHVFELTTTGA